MPHGSASCCDSLTVTYTGTLGIQRDEHSVYFWIETNGEFNKRRRQPRCNKIDHSKTEFNLQQRISTGTTAGGDAGPFQAGGYFREMSSIRASAARP